LNRSILRESAGAINKQAKVLRGAGFS
jgi:hypothetical protein